MEKEKRIKNGRSTIIIKSRFTGEDRTLNVIDFILKDKYERITQDNK